MAMIKTYDHTKVKISLNAIALSDFNGDVTIERDGGDDFETIEGSNGAVERSRMVRKLWTVTLPFMQTTNQLNAIEALRVADIATGAGPFPFAIADLNGAYLLVGQAWVKSMGAITKGRAATPRTVTLQVYEDVGFQGA